jgi:hypothetical protein
MFFTLRIGGVGSILAAGTAAVTRLDSKSNVKTCNEEGGKAAFLTRYR